jgi:hypothetical protein
MATDLRLHLASERLVEDPPIDDDARAADLTYGEDILLLLEICERRGYRRVHRWLRHLAESAGEDVCGAMQGKG